MCHCAIFAELWHDEQPIAGQAPEDHERGGSRSSMNRVFCFSVAVWMMTAALPSLAQQAPVRIVGLVELSGTGATSGTNFDNGIKLAVKEINAAGGILGRKIDRESFMTTVVNGKQQVLATLPPASAK
jgi:ABC-type branched-subunit amino acid transport system substrate-binding protein